MVPPQLRLRAQEGRPVPPGTLLSVEGLPAGVYRVDPSSIAAAHGAAVVRLGPVGRPVAEWRESITLPAGAALLVIEGDDAAQATSRGLALQPMSVVAPGDRVYPRPARRAAVYGTATVYAFDDNVWLEGPGLWVPGGVAVPLVVAKAGARRVEVRLRNGPLPNRVEIEGGGWRADLSLAPREERTVEVPLRGTPPAALMQVKTERGFKPSETTPGNADERYLGVWISIPGDR